MKIRIDSNGFRFRLPTPTCLVLNTPAVWLWLRHKHQALPWLQVAQMVHSLRAWKKQNPALPLLEVRTKDTLIRIDL